MNELHDKVAVRGVGLLTDAELLAFVLDDRALAEAVMSRIGSLAELARTDLSRLRMVEGMGMRKAEKIAAAAELGRRIVSAESAALDTVASSEDVVRIVRPLMGDLSHEECRVLYLTNSNRVLENRRESQGGVQATIVDHRLIVKRAIELLATQIIVVHNHPSGSADPSEADKTLTERIRKAAALFDIRLTDHIIIAGSHHFSFRGQGLL